MGNHQTPFAKRLAAERLTFDDLMFFTGISHDRLQSHSKGKGTLTSEELARIESVLTTHSVVYAMWRSAAEAATHGFKVPTVTIPAV
jgi:hypothetical protein